MKSKAKILLILAFVLVLLTATLAISFAFEDGNEINATAKFEVYNVDPSTPSATPAHKEFESTELIDKIQAYMNAGMDIWIVMNTDCTLTLPDSTRVFTYAKSLYIDMGGHKLTMPNNDGDSALRPENGNVTTVIKNGTLTTGGSKVMYPAGNFHPTFLFENVTFDVAGDFSDYRSGGTVTFNNCTVNLLGTGNNINRFMFIGQNGSATDTPSITGGTTVNVYNTTFNAFASTKINTSDGSIFNLGNRCSNTTRLNIEGCTFNLIGSKVTRVISNSTKGFGYVSIKNSTFNCERPLLYTNSPNTTELTIGEGVSINPKALDSMVTNEKTTVNYPASSVRAYVNETNVEYVAESNTVTVSYYYGTTKVGERLAKLGSTPGYPMEFEDVVYDNGIKLKKAAAFYSDQALTNEVSAITADTTVLYAKSGVGDPVVYATFSGTPSLETLIGYSTSSNEIVNDVASASVKYIEAYADVVMTATGHMAIKRDLTIDLYGHKLTYGGTDTNHTLNPDCVTVTIKNGSLTSAIARLGYPYNDTESHFVYEDLIINWTNSNETMYDFRASGSVTATRCTFNFSNNGKYGMYMFNKQANKTVDMLFTDCTINFAEGSKLNCAFIELAPGASTGNTLNVTMNGCSFNTVSTVPAIVGNSHTAGSVLNVKINEDDSKTTYVNCATALVRNTSGCTTNVTIGKNVVSNKKLDSSLIVNTTATLPAGYVNARQATPPYAYVLTNAYNTVTFIDGSITTTENYILGYSEKLIGESAGYGIVEINGVKGLADKITAWKDAQGNTVSVLAPTANMTLYGSSVVGNDVAPWVIFNSTETEVIASAFDEAYAGITTLPATWSTMIPTNGVLRLFEDITTGNGGNMSFNNGAVVDLNGYKLSLDGGRINLSAITLTIKNGAIAAYNKQNILYSNNGNTGTVYFTDVELIGSTVHCFDFRGGTIYLDGCTYNNKQIFLALATRYTAGRPAKAYINDCDITCTTFATVNGYDGTTPPYTPDATLEVTSSRISTSTFLKVGGAISEDSQVKVKIDGSYIDAVGMFTVNMPANVNVSMKDSYFSVDPTVTNSPYNVTSFNYLDSQGLIETNDEKYPWAVTIPVQLSWNLTLYTDFNANFFLKTYLINSVNINGVDYDLDKLEIVNGSYMITLESIPANEAMKPITITVGYGEGKQITCTKDLTDYANGLFGSANTAKSKKLVASAMAYIATAYDYAGSIDTSAQAMPATLSALLASEQYGKYAPTEKITLSNICDLGNSAIAIKSAQLDLASSLRYRLNLNSAFNGTITVGNSTYTVVNGVDSATGLSYINLAIRAYALYDGTITVSGQASDGTVINGAYSLATYINGVKDSASVEANKLFDALSCYVYYASQYKKEVDNMSNYKFEKNGNGFTLVGLNAPLTELDIPQVFEGLPVTEIAAYVFAGNTDITSVSIPETVKTVGIGAFQGCTSLTSITIAEGVQLLGYGCFRGTAITEIVIPDSVQAIGQSILQDCDKLVSITIPYVGAYRANSNDYFGFIFGATGYVANVDYVPASLKTVVLSSACVNVPAYSFYGCSGIEKVVLSEGVTKIGISAFQGCSSLASIYIPATVTSIPAAGFTYNSPFYGCNENMVIVTEAQSVSYGKYWCKLSETKDATVVNGLSYEEYLESYK